jgi:hypothetical protein
VKGLSDTPVGYFDRFSEDPVILKPFNPETKRFANKYIGRLFRLLQGISVEIKLQGSTAFEIAGKGDVEFGIYPSENDWERILEMLKNHFGEAGNVEENYVRFTDTVQDREIEIIVMRGHEAEVDHRLTEFMINHPGWLKEYEQLKSRYSYSKREYQRQKDLFFRKVVSMI